MPVWDEDLTRDARRPLALGDTGVSPAVTPAVTRSLAHDGVRTAVQKDAAEIIARARRDIRRIVTDARRELLELSAQVQAANVEVPDSPLPDPAVIDTDEAIPHGDEAWLKLEPELETVPAAEAVPDDGHSLTETDPFATPVASSTTARTFVALFTLAGLIVVAGTLWWMTRQPTTATSSAPVSEPVPAPATSTVNPASADAIPAAAALGTVPDAALTAEPNPAAPTRETPRSSTPASSLPSPAPASAALATPSTPRPAAPAPAAPAPTPPPAPPVPSPAPVPPAGAVARGPVPAAPAAPARRRRHRGEV